MSTSIHKRLEHAIKVPELQKVTKAEWRSLYFAAIELGASLTHGNKDAAYEAVHDGFIALCTTHRHDETKYTLKQHFLYLVTKACRTNLDKVTSEQLARDERNAHGYYDDVAPNARGNPEELMIAREEREEHQAWRAKKRAQIRRLTKVLSAHPVALQLMAYWAENGADRPLPQIARILGQPVAAVMEAKKIIERNAQRIIREEEGDDQ